MFDPADLVTFLAAVVAIVLIPGPGQALILARTIERGRRAGVLTSFGLNTGTAIHTFAAALGLSAVLATSALAFTALKLAGAAYLVFLGIVTLRGARAPSAAGAPPSRAGANHLYWRAVLVGILNPKVALFFLAFLPQFVRAERGHAFLQFCLLGGMATLIGVTWDSFVAWSAGSAAAGLIRNPRLARWRERLTGTVLLAMGVRLALVSRR